jgi:hypothetical protein
MRIFFGGSLGLRSGSTADLIRGLTEVLEKLGHQVLRWEPKGNEDLRDLNQERIEACDLFVAFADDLTPQLAVDIQDAIEADKHVLCVTDGRRPVDSEPIIAAGQMGLLDLTHYKDFNDLADKVLHYLVLVSKIRPPTTRPS